MNINFVGKKFDILEELDNYVNHEFEPFFNVKNGKRNTYFDEIKHEFVNDMNIFGFSPFILKSYLEQRENPNINKFISKKFNYGYTNYIKIKTRSTLPFTTKLQRKIKYKTKSEDKNKNKAVKLIPEFFLIKKEKLKNKKEKKGNFLQKLLGEMGGCKLNISFDEVEKKKENENNQEKIKININNNFNLKRRKAIINNMDIIKNILLINEQRENNKTLSFNNIDIFGNRTNNKSNVLISKLKYFFDNINKESTIKKEEKNNITLSKNKYILGNKKLFSSISTRNIHSMETSTRKKRTLRKVNSVEILKNSLNQNLNKFLLFTKAIPYKYLVYSKTHK